MATDFRTQVQNSDLQQKEAILDLLEQAANCDWFAYVGENDLAEYDRVMSWDAAISYLKNEDSDSAWTAVGERERNQMAIRANKEDSDRFDSEWNPIARLVREAVTSVLQSSMIPVLKRESIDEVVHGMCKSVFLNHCIYMSYFDDPQFPSVARECVDLFLAGHCPCGYVGKVPDGKLIIY